MFNKIKRLIRFFLNILNNVWLVVRFKGAVIKVQCQV